MKSKNYTKWYIKFPGNAYAIGPTVGYYFTEKQVREMIRDSYGFNRVPHGTQIWRA